MAVALEEGWSRAPSDEERELFNLDEVMSLAEGIMDVGLEIIGVLNVFLMVDAHRTASRTPRLPTPQTRRTGSHPKSVLPPFPCSH